MRDEHLLYDLTDSPFCMKARICLHLKGVPYRTVTLTVGRRRELRRLNPLGKVPVLVHGADVIADSSTIARWVEDHYPDPALIPADPEARDRSGDPAVHHGAGAGRAAGHGGRDRRSRR